MIPERVAAGRSIVSDSARTLLLKVLLAVVAFGASVLLSRGLGPAGRGEYYLPIVAAGTMVALCKLGLEQANVFLYGSRAIAVERLSRQNGVVALGAGGLGALALLLAPALLPGVFAGTPRALLVLAGLTIPFTLHTQFSAGVLTLQGRVTWQFVAALVAAGMQVLLLLGLLLLRQFEVGPVLLVYLVTTVLTWLLVGWALDRRGNPWLGWDLDLLRQTLARSLVLHVGMVFFFLHLRLDMFMVKGIVGTAALGLYSLSVVLAETVLLPTDSLALAILPRQVGNTLPEAASMALRGARTNGLLGVGLAALWVLAGATVVRIFFGAEFATAYLPLVALLPGMVFLGMQRVCGGAALRAGRPGRITAIYALSLLCNIALNLWWIPRLGIVGAALASSASYGLGALLFLTWTARLAGAPLLEGLIPRRSDWVVLWQAAMRGMQLLAHTPNKQAPLG